MIRWLITAPALTSTLVFALPTGMQGAAQVEGKANHLNVTVGERAHLKWQDFSIGKGESVHFSQPGVNSVVINHVVGGEISQILGKLSAQGTLYLVNPSGIFVGKEALIDVGSFIASTMQGFGDKVEERYHLKGSKGSITIDGKIIAHSGDVILASHQIDCSGEITAEKGVALAAGKEVIIQPGKESRAFVKAIGGQRLTSDGNLFSLAINQKGVVDGEVTIRGSVGAKEVAITAGGVRVSGAVRGEKIDCRAISSLASSGSWSAKEMSLRSGGSLSLGRVQLIEGGSIALQMRHVDFGRLSQVIEDLLQKGDVTLVGDSVQVGDFRGYGEVFTTTAAHRLRLEGCVVNIREGLALAGDFEVQAKDLTIGADDHGSSAALTVESKEGKIRLGAEALHLFDGSERTALCAKEIELHAGNIEVIAEGKGCDLHADDLLKIVGPGELLLDARGSKSAITLRGSGLALKEIEKGTLIARGEGARIQVRAESALGMSGGALECLTSGAGSNIEWSAPQMALRLKDFRMSAEGASSKAELISGALQLVTDKTITLAALGKGSLAQIALTTGGRNFILAGEDLTCKGALGEVQIANVGGAVGLVMYAGRDLIFESKALVEIAEGDFSVEAGRDLILRDRPRMITQRGEGPAVQLLGQARGDRREIMLTLGDFFEKIAAREKDAASTFAAFANGLVRAQAPDLVESIQPFDVGSIEFVPLQGLWGEYIDLESDFTQTHGHIANDRRSIEHALCQSMRELGLQGKFAATLRRGLLKAPNEHTVSPRSRPWKVWAEAERDPEPRSADPLAADID